MSIRNLFTASAFAIMLAAPAFAQQAHVHDAAAASASIEAYEQANARMHENMAIDYTGNADVDFARGMIPHHQGAIDMAKVVLEHGSDPDIRKLAEEVIAAQEGEIAFLKEWLEKNGQ